METDQCQLKLRRPVLAVHLSQLITLVTWLTAYPGQSACTMHQQCWWHHVRTSFSSSSSFSSYSSSSFCMMNFICPDLYTLPPLPQLTARPLAVFRKLYNPSATDPRASP
ncbi:unnamed protein product [Protopolystoma xenopodis]|uniref:Uncharacterized protein n=1 Tax=Protopolystoma xenopodis TaxID=117903 RepID=A0A3S5CMC6_9PLAT|nr:unnamed protein product [Protopolystoma xenopodis]